MNSEKAFQIDYAVCATTCRMALEFAVKWLYSVDGALKMPYDTKLVSLASTDEFKDVVDSTLLTEIHYICKLGNNAVHNAKSISRDQAVLSLQNLHSFMDFIAYINSTIDESNLQKTIVKAYYNGTGLYKDFNCTEKIEDDDIYRCTIAGIEFLIGIY